MKRKLTQSTSNKENDIFSLLHASKKRKGNHHQVLNRFDKITMSKKSGTSKGVKPEKKVKNLNESYLRNINNKFEKVDKFNIAISTEKMPLSIIGNNGSNIKELKRLAECRKKKVEPKDVFQTFTDFEIPSFETYAFQPNDIIKKIDQICESSGLNSSLGIKQNNTESRKILYFYS